MHQCEVRHKKRTADEQKKLVTRLKRIEGLLACHIRGCVANDIRQGKDESIDELVTVLQKLMK